RMHETDLGDAPVLDGDVAAAPGEPRAVDHDAAHDGQVVGAHVSLLQPVGSAGPDDRLQLRVRLQAVVPAVASDARHLEPAEGRLVVALRGVDADVPGPQLLGDLE